MVLDARRRRDWPAVIVLCLANFLILLDTTIVNTAAPDIMASLSMGVDAVLWVINGYLLAFASLLIVFSRLGDRIGPRTLFAAGLAVFSAASALCGLSGSGPMLIGARVMQGVGAAALMPQALVLISTIFPAHRRGAALGVFTAMAGVAAVAGPTLGGLLVTDVGWQSVFYLNVPVGVVALLLTFRLIPDVRPARTHRFDIVGVLLATAALVALVFGLVEGQRYDWGRVWGPVSVAYLLGAALVAVPLFVLWERRQPEPLVPLSLFGTRNFAVATVITVLGSLSLYGFLFVFVLQTQSVSGMSPLRSGLTALPWTLTLSAVAPLAGRLTDRIGGRTLLIAGLAAQSLGVLGLALWPGRSPAWTAYLPPLVLIGVGMGLSIAPATTEAMRHIRPDQIGAASGVLNTARQAGAAMGAALVGAVLQSRLLDCLHQAVQRRAQGLPPAARGQFVAELDRRAAQGLRVGGPGTAGLPPGIPAQLADQLDRAARSAFGDAFLQASRPTLGLVAAVLLAGSLVAIRVVPAPRRAGPAAAEVARTADQGGVGS
jgi:EmrB/QacA subfamily drug resistance transporter